MSLAIAAAAALLTDVRAGVQLFQGMLRRRCYLSEASTDYFVGDDSAWVCSMPLDSGMNSCAPDDDASATYRVCKEDGPNPSDGVISFDNIGCAGVVVMFDYSASSLGAAATFIQAAV